MLLFQTGVRPKAWTKKRQNVWNLDRNQQGLTFRFHLSNVDGILLSYILSSTVILPTIVIPHDIFPCIMDIITNTGDGNIYTHIKTDDQV